MTKKHRAAAVTEQIKEAPTGITEERIHPLAIGRPGHLPVGPRILYESPADSVGVRIIQLAKAQIVRQALLRTRKYDRGCCGQGRNPRHPDGGSTEMSLRGAKHPVDNRGCRPIGVEVPLKATDPE